MIEEEVEPSFCGIGGVDNVNVYHRDDSIYLYGADDISTHFNVTNLGLKFTQLKEYGYDRETSKALIALEYASTKDLVGAYSREERSSFWNPNKD